MKSSEPPPAELVSQCLPTKAGSSAANSIVMFLLLSLRLAVGGAATIVPVLQTAFTNPSPAVDDRFASALSSLGSDCVIIGAPDDDAGKTNAGAAYLFNADGMLLNTYTNPAPEVNDQFGCSVAAVGNDCVLIGAYGKDAGGPDAGAAYLFNTNGALVTTLTNPALASYDEFGCSVAAVGKACLLIGARGNDTGAEGSGVAYLFSKNGTLLTTFTNPAPTVGSWFGSSVAAMGSDRVLIGAPYAESSGALVGAAYLFSTNGTLLATFNHPLTGQFPGAGQKFGISMAAVGSDRVLVGAPGTDTDPTVFIYRYGAAYLFSTNGVLLTSIHNPSREEGLFGNSVASLGNELLLVGAPRNRLTAGSAYLFSTNGTLISVVTKPATVSGLGSLGNAVLAMGNSRVFVGASLDDTSSQNTGAAYLFSIVPTLDIQPATSTTLAVSWSVFAPDFALQQNTNGIASGNWSSLADTIHNNGTNKWVIVDPTTGNRFYRLIKP